MSLDQTESEQIKRILTPETLPELPNEIIGEALEPIELELVGVEEKALSWLEKKGLKLGNPE